MEYFIEGNYPMLKCRLNRGETIKTSAGSMSWMSDGFDLEVKSGGLGKGIARMFSGENMFINYYTANKDNQEIVFSSSLPGEIKHIKMEGQTLIGQKSSYLASDTRVASRQYLQRNFQQDY